MKTLDHMMRRYCGDNLNLCVPWYLSAAYAYYELDEPILSDAAFDGLAKMMLEHWDQIEHRHKNMITVDDLQAGTLLNREWPEVMKGATQSLMEKLR